MRVLITGASGLIGSTLSAALLRRGDEVVGLSRDPSRAGAKLPEVEWHRWRPASERPPEQAFVGIDAVFNLIGENLNQRLGDDAKQRIRDSRVRATKNLVDGMQAAPETPPVLISQNAVGYYGDRGDTVLDESAPPAEDWVGQLCRDWEAAAIEAEGPGIRVVVLRTGLVLDPNGGLLGQLLLPFRFGLGGPLAGGHQYTPWIHRDDVVGLMLWALGNDRVRGPLNATAPEPVTNREFSRALGRALRRPAVVPAPKLAVRVMRGSELADQVTASLRVVPRRALDLGYSFRHTDVEAALRNLLRA